MAASKGPVPEWTVREQLILASAVQRSGDQNWVSVSRAVKPLVEDARPPDYFSQKNCALQYSAMLDKAKHPKRKRSSDGTPESVTVEEQIVRQLTEKRMKELSLSIAETRREYHALKKETEMIDKGELDTELPGLWEKAQAELAVKESTDTKGSRSRKSSAGPSPEKRHKSSTASGSARDDKSRATGLEKSHTNKSPDKRQSLPQTPGSSSTTASPLHGIKEEKMEVTPPLMEKPQDPSLVPTPLSTSPSTPRPAVKKRTLESLPLGSGVDSFVAVHDESPLPCPMTVPKEEKLQESIAASGGPSLMLPLSPDMHIIVQQPNIAAITASAAPIVTTAQEIGVRGNPINVPPPMPRKPQPQAIPQPPLPAPQLPATKAVTLTETTASTVSADVKLAQQRENRDKDEEEESKPITKLPVFEKQELPTAPSVLEQPTTAADTPSVTVPTSTTTLPPPPIPSHTQPHSAQLLSTTASSAVIQQPQPDNVALQASSSTTPPLPSPSPTKVAVLPTPTTSTQPPPSSSPSPSTQSHSHLTTPSPSTLPSLPPHLHSSAMTVVSSVLSDPRLSSGIVRPGPIKVAPLWPTVTKTKPQAVAKSRPPGETEKKGSSTEMTTTFSPSTEPLKQPEKSKQEAIESPEKPADSQSQEPEHPSQVVDEHKVPQELVRTPEKLPESKQEPNPPQTPSPNSKPATVQQETSVVETMVTEEVKEDEGREVGEDKKEEAEMTEKDEESHVEPALSPQTTHSSSGKAMSEEKEQTEDMQEMSGVLLDEQVLVDAGSSRRSSVSEIASSPLAGVPKDKAEGEILRKQAKTSTSKKLWAIRSRKRKLDIEEGTCMSVESTDLDSEEEPSSLITSAAPSPAPSQSDGDQDGGMSKKQWKKAIMLVWRHAAQHKYANLFLHPVKEDDAPGYREVIHRPMDLSSIKRNIENGITTTDIEFQRDMLLMFQNAFMYNSSDHDVYDMAEKMRADVMQSIQDYLSTQLQLIVESSTPKVLRSRDKEGRRGDIHDEGTPTPVKKRRTRADD